MKEQLSQYLQVEHFNSNEQKNFYHEKLTERQIELISYLEKGYSNKEIADKMFITEATVKYHIKNIYEILELKNRKEFFAKKIKIQSLLDFTKIPPYKSSTYENYPQGQFFFVLEQNTPKVQE